MRDREKVVDRIRQNVLVSDSGCWIWQMALDPSGYGKAYAPGVPSRGAHRIAYLAFVGPIPDGHEIDHTCFNRSCCNPSHLRAIPGLQNKREQRSAFVMTCKWGHPRSRAPSGRMVCSTCQNEAVKRWRSRNVPHNRREQ